VRAQRRRVGPLLEEEQAQGILAVDMQVMRDAAGFGPRPRNMFKARAKNLLEGVLARQTASRTKIMSPPCAIVRTAALLRR